MKKINIYIGLTEKKVLLHAVSMPTANHPNQKYQPHKETFTKKDSEED
jgi:hypothetical protein